MEAPDIDEGSLQAVKSLRSKFERLASETSSNQHPASSSELLTATAPASPRPRATSSSQVDSGPPEAALQLRASASSSDLTASGKRVPPPPPPPRGSKLPIPTPLPSPSPVLSPLLRPVPIPPGANSSNKEPSGVSQLKSKFDTSPSLSSGRIQSQRQSIIPTQPDLIPVIPSRPVSFLANTRHDVAQNLFSENEQNTPGLTSSSSGVSHLKNKFDISPSPPGRTQSPRQSMSSLHADMKPVVPPRPTSLLVAPRQAPDVAQGSSSDSEEDTSSVSPPKQTIPSVQVQHLRPDSKPVIPPRPASLLATTRQPEDVRVPGQNFLSEAEQIRSELSKSAPPPIPTRQNFDTNSIRALSAQQNDWTSDNDVSQGSSRPIHIPPPPRPPPRHLSISPNAVDHPPKSFSLPASNVPSPPPPLPVRRSTVAVQDVPTSVSAPPPLPSRSQVEVLIERKALGASKLPPPPTRTVGLGDKLPPPRRPSTPSSDEDSGEEDTSKAQVIDLMPDSSTSSRRPPTLSFRDGYSDPPVHVHPQNGCVVISGTYAVVAHGHNIKIYDLAVSDIPTFNLDTKEFGLKDAKITCMEIRPTISTVDSGSLVWVGTKEGNIFELDMRNGSARGTKYSAHLYPITHIFRHGRSIVSMDESGKALVFSPDSENQEDITLNFTIPRVVRTTDKQDFAKMIDGKLWTAARLEHHGTAPSQRLPVIRVYDIFNPANPAGRSILPIEHVGPVTSAAIITTQPRTVYVGHEEGFISIWELDTEDGYPLCVEVMKVSASDVLSLEGVNNRLWAGSRNGMISAYDVSQKPWIVTNSWNAHPGLPVVKLMVNHFAIAKIGRLSVASIGRDEQMRIWDGLLGLDWIDKELLKQETSFSSFQDLTVLVVSWNCDSARPDSLMEGEENVNFLNDVLHSVDPAPDVIVFGFQEVIDLESRKMVAKNVLLGGKKKPEDGGLSDKVTGAYKRWHERLTAAVKTGMPKEHPYCVIHTESLIGLFTCIFAKISQKERFGDGAIKTVKRGMGGRYGNKGGIVARFVVGDSSICFINCHLAAGQSAVRQRNADIAGMLEDKALFPPTQHPLAYVGGGDGSMVLDHEFVILNGDLNYRIDHRRDAIIASVKAGDLASLLTHDQLLREIKFNRACRLRGFAEGPLTFPPTYKYDPRSNEYDTSEKHRPPAWCDRVLWRSRVATRVRQLHYRRYEANVSDHRPISAAFAITVKKFDMETREKARAALQAKWTEVQEQLLEELNAFYVNQALI